MKAFQELSSYLYIVRVLYIRFLPIVFIRFLHVMYMQPSVFDLSNQSVSFYLDNVLDSFSQTYHKIVVVSAVPPGPLADMVTPMRFPPLSEFQTRSPFSSACSYVLLRYPKQEIGHHVSLQHPHHFMTQQDIPSLLAYLSSHGYTIQTELTKLISQHALHSHDTSSRKFICFATYASS